MLNELLLEIKTKNYENIGLHRWAAASTRQTQDFRMIIKWKSWFSKKGSSGVGRHKTSETSESFCKSVSCPGEAYLQAKTSETSKN